MGTKQLMINDSELRLGLLEAPITQLDPSMVELVKTWGYPAKALEVLEVLDKSIHASLASGFTITLLQLLYEEALGHENKTHEELLPLAHWRKTEN